MSAELSAGSLSRSETAGAVRSARPTDAPRWLQSQARRAERVVIPLAALLVGLSVFSLFLLALGKSPTQFYSLVFKAGFGTQFSWENTLSRTAPLLLSALCVALPARLGLVVIGGEGALVLGGLAAGAVGAAVSGTSGFTGIVSMALAGMFAGGLWIGAVGAMRHWRGVNETIASLLMAYIAVALLNHFVEGPLRDPASLNKPSTAPIDAAHHLGTLPFLDVHYGLVIGVVACVLAWIVLDKTRIGFAARVVGGNARAARIQALPVGSLTLGFTVAAGACAGLAGMIEVSAVHGSANGSLNAGYGYTGILIAFIAQHNPLAVIPVAVLLAAFEAASGLVQRRMALPDATVLVMQGMVFVAILVSETFYGRFKVFSPERWRT
ncbi:MAG: ABC transporter permease [Burkholderiaceae bacterium]